MRTVTHVSGKEYLLYTCGWESKNNNLYSYLNTFKSMFFIKNHTHSDNK